ncbi:MAG: hypothetical protein GXY60_12820 [Spirochaetales bacterium]|nr:hypothetical protein [Spirochaetales bacterium]
MKIVQDALRPTGIPAFAGAWRPTATQPTAPEQYLVYTTMTREDEHWDDAFQRYRVYVYLNLWSANDPTTAISTVRAAMRQAGFAMLEESDSYSAEARQALVAWTWVFWSEPDNRSEELP